MKINKNKYAVESNEWIQLRGRIKEILMNKRTIGLATQALMYLIQDEIVKSKKERMK